MAKKRFIKAIKAMLKFLPLGFWLVLIFAFDKPYIAILTLIAAAAHELGHILAFMRYTKKYRLFGVTSGLRLSSVTGLSYKEEMAVALAGPIANVFIFLFCTPFILLSFSEYAKIFGLVNLFTAVSNLIPIEGYDGYRVLNCFLNQYTKLKIPETITRSLSFLISAVLSLTALYLIRSFDGGYWVFFIFLASLVRAISSDRSIFMQN